MREIFRTILTILAVGASMLTALYLLQKVNIDQFFSGDITRLTAGPLIVGSGVLLSAVFASIFLKKDSKSI